MRRVQQTISGGERDAWRDLRRSAEQVSFPGEGKARDTTRLPQWWTIYARDFVLSSARDSEAPGDGWNASRHILRVSGSELGLPVWPPSSMLLYSSNTVQANGPPEGNLAQFIANMYAIDKALYALQDAQVQDLLELGEIESTHGDDLMLAVQAQDA